MNQKEKELILNISLIEDKLKNIETIPTLSSIASELLEMISSNDFSLKKVSLLLTQDQSITVKILKIANSAYYGLRKNIDTLKMALVVLGTNEITDIILSLSLIKTFSDDSKTDFDRSWFWKHSSVVAHLCKKLVHEFDISTHGEEFTAGLLHDIGKIILDQYFHVDYQHYIEESKFKTKSLRLFDLEAKIIGATHMDVGTWLGKRWKIPYNLLECILYHHEPKKAIYNKELVSIVSLANILANSRINNENVLGEVRDYKETEAWEILTKNNPNHNIDGFIDNLDAEIEKAIELFEMI